MRVTQHAIPATRWQQGGNRLGVQLLVRRPGRLLLDRHKTGERRHHPVLHRQRHDCRLIRRLTLQAGGIHQLVYPAPGPLAVQAAGRGGIAQIKPGVPGPAAGQAARDLQLTTGGHTAYHLHQRVTLKQVSGPGRHRFHRIATGGPAHGQITHHRGFHGRKQPVQGAIHLTGIVYRGELATAPAGCFPQKVHIGGRADAHREQPSFIKAGTNPLEQRRFIAYGTVRDKHHLLHQSFFRRLFHRHRQ